MAFRHCLAVVAVAGFVVGCAAPDETVLATNDPSYEERLPEGAAGNVPGSQPVVVDETGALSGGQEPSSAADANDALMAIVRDFKMYNAADPTTLPDFENVPVTDHLGNPNPKYHGPWDDREIVTETLGDDGKPVYKNVNGRTVTTHGKDTFDKWYRDVPGTNLRIAYPLQMTRNPDRSYEYDSEKSGAPLSKYNSVRMFFPIDDGTAYKTAFTNQGDAHNYSFTVELHTTFVYKGGEYFRFRGDDDIFVYINKRLVINLGGIHGAEPAEVRVDDLGLVKGQNYSLDFFSAERHKDSSDILFTTTLELRSVVR